MQSQRLFFRLFSRAAGPAASPSNETALAAHAPSPRLGQRVAFRLAVLLGSCIVAVVAVMGVYIFEYYTRHEHQEALDQSRSHAVRLARLAPPWLAAGDRASIEDALLDVVRFPKMVEAAILDKTGRPYARVVRGSDGEPRLSADDTVPSPPTDGERPVQMSDDRIARWEPIGQPPRHWVYLAYLFESPEEDEYEIPRHSAAIMVVALALGVGLLLLALRRPLRQLERVTRFAAALPVRRGETLAFEQGPYEFERLRQTLNQVSGVLAQQDLQVAAANRTARELASALEQTADSVAITDRDGIIEYVNPAFERNTGYSRAEALGRKSNLAKSGVHDVAFYRDLWDTILRGEVYRGVIVNRRKDGERYYEEKTITPLKNEHGEVTRFISTGKDITERMRAEDALARFGRILDHSSNEIYVFCADSLCFTQVNRGARRNLGYRMEELARLTPLDLKPEYTRERFEALIAPLRAGETETLSFETLHRRKDGSHYPVEVRLHYSHAEHPPVFVAVIQDITERRNAESQLKYLANYDSLTGLPNRTLLRERLDQTIISANRYQRLVGVLLLDLDNFKTVNDSLGHEAGDALLKHAARRLEESVRPGDTVARLGGDEFVVVLADIAHVDDIVKVAAKIHERIARPISIAGCGLSVSASSGITVYPFDDETGERLLKNADAAMYHAKARGRNSYQFFTAELNTRIERRLAIEQGLRHALERGEFELHYQPQVDVMEGRVVGVEALLRWRRPEWGLVPPLDFIPLAEETGLIAPISEWVLAQACTEARTWQKMGLSKIKVAVNFSGRDFEDARLADRVAQALAQTGLAAECLDVEITEGLLMQNLDEVSATLNKLSDMGVTVSLDDFGTGYSSLSYLRRLPIDVLKVDRSFVRDIPKDAEAGTIARTIIMLAHSLGAKVIAEGVETDAQLGFLHNFGCDAMQGYLVAKPMPAAELRRWLADRQERKPLVASG